LTPRPFTPPDGVRQHQLVRWLLGHLRGGLQHPPRLYPPLERAAERHAQRDGDPNPVFPGAAREPPGELYSIRDGGVLVAPGELLGDREGVADLIHPGGHRPVVALLVEDEPGVDNALLAIYGGHDLLGPGHLRHAPGVDEAGGLHAPYPGRGQPVAELGAHLRGESLLLVLQAVARPNLDYFDAHQTIPLSASSRCSPALRPSTPP
jgi:hypothetical protein